MSPITESRYRRVQIELSVITGFLIAAVVSCFIWLLWEVDNREDDRAQTRENICSLFNQDREQRRIDAWKAYNDLGRTLRLLNVKRTPEIVEAAKQGRDRKLRNARPIPCHIFVRGDELGDYIVDPPAKRPVPPRAPDESDRPPRR